MKKHVRHVTFGGVIGPLALAIAAAIANEAQTLLGPHLNGQALAIFIAPFLLGAAGVLHGQLRLEGQALMAELGNGELDLAGLLGNLGGLFGDGAGAPAPFNKAPASIAEATKLFINETDNDGNGIAALIATWDDSTNTALRGTLTFRKIGTPATFAVFSITAVLTDKGAWDVLTVAHVAHGGTFADLDPVSVEFSRTGDKGAAGATGEEGPGGFSYTYQKEAGELGVGGGRFHFNNLTLASATKIIIANTPGTPGGKNKGILTRLVAGKLLFIRAKTLKSETLLFKLTSGPTEKEGSQIYSVEFIESNASAGWAEQEVTISIY